MLTGFYEAVGRAEHDGEVFLCWNFETDSKSTTNFILALAFAGIMLCGCSAPGDGARQSASLFGSTCKPFDPDITNSCMVSSERWSEIPELPEPPGMYRYCAWPGLLSGAYRTRYRDVDGTVHDFTDAPAMTPSFLLEAVKGVDNSPETELIEYRMMPMSHPCTIEAP
jgi:hypothetical protein